MLKRRPSVVAFPIASTSDHEPSSICLAILLNKIDASEVQAQETMHLESYKTNIHEYQRTDELSKLEEAISHMRHAIQLAEATNPAKPGRLADLGAILGMRYQRLRNVLDLEEATSHLTLAVEITEDTNPMKAQYLTNLANMQKFRYTASGEIEFLRSSIRSSQKADTLSDDKHPHKPFRLAGLGNAFTQLYECNLDLDDLESSLAMFRRALALVPDGDPFKMRIIAGVGNSLRYKFERSEDTRDLDESISHLQISVDLAPHTSPLRPKYLVNLGISLRLRYTHIGESAALQGSLKSLQESAGLLDEANPDMAICLSHLGLTQTCLFKDLGDVSYIEDSIMNLQAAVRLSSVMDLPGDLCNLALAQRTKFNHSGDIGDIEGALVHLKRALQLTHDGHSTRILCLWSLGTCQRLRYMYLSALEDIQNSVSNLAHAVDLVSMTSSHPHRTHILSELGRSLETRYQALGSKSDIEDSVANHRLAVSLGANSKGGNSQASRICGLANSLRLRFEVHSELKDISEAVYWYNQAINLAGESKFDSSDALGNLGLAQLRLFEHSGDVNDIEQAVHNLGQAVEISDTSAQRSVFLSYFRSAAQSTKCVNSKLTLCHTFSFSRFVRFTMLDDMNDLNDSIATAEITADDMADGHAHKPSYLANLGISLCCRFNRVGGLSDLENSILHLQNAVHLVGDQNPQLPEYLSQLAASQTRRYHCLHDRTDLQNSQLNLSKAVDLTYGDHPLRPMLLASLGTNAKLVFNSSGDSDWLDYSIRYFKQALQLTADTQPMAWKLHEGLGTSQEAVFKQSGRISDIDEAIASYRTAVRLTGDGDLSMPGRMLCLGVAIYIRFQSTRSPPDLEEYFSFTERAVDLADDNDPIKVRCLIGRGDALQVRFKIRGDPADCLSALSAYRTAAQSKMGLPDMKFHAAQQWVDFAHEQEQLESALAGYRIALEILPKLAWLGLDLPSRQNRLGEAKTEDMTCCAASCAISLGQLEEAVELLELGRSVLWQQASSLRHEAQLLEEQEPEMAEELERIGRRLEAGNFLDSFIATAGQRAYEDVRREHRLLVEAWETLLEKVRKLPGFAFFLKPVPFQQLRQATSTGYVVVINASIFGVDALVFDATHPIQHVPLPDTDIATIGEQVKNLVLRRPQSATPEQRRKYMNGIFKPTLRATWNDIVRPIFEHVGISLEPDDGYPQQRIWWYPTGLLTFLPIHAAGPGSGRIDVSSLVVSSYTTTLGSLFQAYEAQNKILKTKRKLLAISQTDTPGQTPLPLSGIEVNNIIEVVHQAGWSTADIIHLENSDATCDRVLEALETCSWVHFACHGMQDLGLGMKSSFALHDGALEMKKIASKRLLNAQLAFLSVCNAAAGMRILIGESMHLAGKLHPLCEFSKPLLILDYSTAGLQFAGFSSVVATMWAINDEDGPRVARHFYDYMLRRGLEECDISDAAAALNYAVMRLRRDHNVPPERWAPFIHFGV